MTNVVSEKEVRSQILGAWSATLPPDRCDIPSDPSGYHLECQQVADFFGGKEWSSIRLVELRDEYLGDHSACLHFMSPPAFAYYLATYMMLALDSFDEADLSGEAAVAALAPRGDAMLAEWQATRRAAMSAEQQKAVASFLEWFSEHHGDDCSVADPHLVLEHWRHAV